MNDPSHPEPDNRADTGIYERIEQVTAYLRRFDGVLVAFSGGVDSSTLAALAYMALGDRSAAVTAQSQTLPKRELESAGKTAKSIGIKHFVIHYNELDEPGFASNPVDRCFHCKTGLFRALKVLANESGFEAVADGTNASELTGHRPGHKAALEQNILTPFADMGITKDEIRQIARLLGLDIWDKPQQACLSSRFPYGHSITIDGLEQVEQAEDMLFALGIEQCRVRHHDDTARIEVPERFFEIVLKNKETLITLFKSLGYTYITLDIEGFRSGSFDISPNQD
ncbi:MAG: ATP-dependent sacrificial sulfur transferase LarE [ANME-2 cluster archaeon]|nr:ATP-dependent sacrificial sulfur transferase LarE [ANME-2 cluster archaeon]